MQPDPQPHRRPVRPGAGAHPLLDRDGSFECRRGTLERCKDVIAASGDDVAARGTHRGAHDTADITEQAGVPIAEAPEQFGRALDIGQQERDLAFGELSLRLQLGADEADGHDAVLLGRSE